MLTIHNSGPSVEFYKNLEVYHIGQGGARSRFYFNENGKLVLQTYAGTTPEFSHIFEFDDRELTSFLTFIDQHILP